MKYYRSIIPFLALLLVGLFQGCIADKCSLREMDENGEITLILKAPAMDVDASLRQMSASQESAVEKLHILVFKTKDNTGSSLSEAEETFAYVAPISTIRRLSTNDNFYEVRARLRVNDTTNPYRLVLIANHDFDTSILTEGMTKSQLFQNAEMMKAFSTAWATTAGATIPMWGESNAQIIAKGVKFGDCFDSGSQDKIHLIRSLARVDVGLNFTGDVTSETPNPTADTPFKLKSVRVYRYATKFSVPGSQQNTFRMQGATRDPQPVLPSPLSLSQDTKPFLFETTSESSSVREIYIPERSKSEALDTRACLVVGGVFDGSSKETFYRLDFIKAPKVGSPRDTAEALDILRNHRYRFNIKKVTGPGNDTPEDALISEPINISFDVVVWDEAEVGEVVYDGQYYLAVDKKDFEFGKDPSTQMLTIRTNWPKGYKIVDENGKEYPRSQTAAEGAGQWIFFEAPTGQTFAIDKDQKENISVLENTTGSIRKIPSGKLFVQAGRIKWPLTVTQLDKVKLDIQLYEKLSKDSPELSAHTISHLEMKESTSTDDHAKYVAVKYTKGAKLERFPLSNQVEQFHWTLLSDDPAKGEAIYRVEMISGTALSDDFNITELSRFKASKGSAEATADLNVIYMAYNAIPYRERAMKTNMLLSNENYVLINIPAEFYIKANAPYKLEVESIKIEKGSKVTDTKGVVHDWEDNTLVYEALSGQISGDKITFQPYDWVHPETYTDSKGVTRSTTPGELFSATVHLKITATDPTRFFAEKKFKINLTAGIIQPEANSYIMKSQQRVPILIPCSRINTAADWYQQWEEECEEVVEYRNKLTASTANISNAQRTAYNNDGKCTLPRLEENDHNIEAKVIWSTIVGPNRVAVPTGDFSGIATLKPVVVDGKNYLMVALNGKNKDDEGNALVGVRRPGEKEFLWSWHIWVVEEYPWKPAGGRSPYPFLNRNLGARYVYGRRNGTVRIPEVGLAYQFGRKDPFYLDRYRGRASLLDALDKNRIYLGDPAFEAQNMTGQKPVAYGTGLSYNKLYTMKQLIQYPYMFAGHDRNEGYILEMGGPNWQFMNGATLWQGQAIYTRHDEKARINLAVRTIKTPFDPSPYGWKVPSVGVYEMGKLLDIAPSLIPNNGLIKASGNYYEYVIDSIVHLHTATTDIGGSGSSAIFNNGCFMLKPVGDDQWKMTFNTSAFYPNAPATGLPVRSISNERETDFLNYTEEGFYRSARSGR